MPSSKQAAYFVERASLGLAVVFGLGAACAISGCAGELHRLEGALVAVDMAADKLAASWEAIAEHEEAYCSQMPDYDKCMAKVREVGDKVEKALGAVVVGQEASLLLIEAMREMQALECGRHPEGCK